MNYRPALYAIASVAAAIILFITALVTGSSGSSVRVLPGVSLIDSPFAELGTDPLIAMGSLLYPANYEIVNERPYIIRVDYHDADSVTEPEAEGAAQQFINEVFTNESIQQLEVDRRLTQLRGALPKWTINFRNNTYSVPIHIEASVTVNALSGEIIGYAGRPILCQGEADNQSTAEGYAIAAMKEMGYLIPSNSRVFSMNWTDPTAQNGVTYRFRFQEVCNDAMIDTRIGTLSVEIDAASGGLQFLSFEWIQMDEIPVEDVLSVDRVGDDALLTLVRVSEADFDEIRPQEFRLCWVRQEGDSGRTLLLDAFTGDLVDARESFGVTHSQDYATWILLTPVLVSTVPAALFSLGTKELLRRRMKTHDR
ncbi:MAG: hypothetical protein C4K47_01555 [Candidatus Thorarchaeota archaeon]|nr:MAG: hypothetical protein C4K47_01555 [Candidatus Thorarchaeota archaeon]